MPLYSMPKNIPTTRATGELVRSMNLHPSVMGNNLEIIAAEAVKEAVAAKGANVAENASELFADRAKAHILRHLRRYAIPVADIDDPLHIQRYHSPKAYDDLSGLFMDADYAQVFAMILLGQKNVRKHMGNYEPAFQRLIEVVTRYPVKGDESCEGWTNYATFLANATLEDSEAAISTIHNVVETSIRRDTTTLNTLIQNCASYYRDIIRAKAEENLDIPSELFGRFKNVNSAELVASRIEKMGIRRVVMRMPQEMAFFVNPHEDVEKAVRRRYRPDRKMEFDGENGRFLDDSGNEIISFSCSPVVVNKIHVLFPSGIEDCVYCANGENPEEIIRKRYLVTGRTKTIENGPNDSGRFLDGDFREILRWKPEEREEPEVSPGMRM